MEEVRALAHDAARAGTDLSFNPWLCLRGSWNPAPCCCVRGKQEGLARPHLLPSTSALQDHEKQYVGFATLPNQVHRKSVKKGFDFTLMVAGEIACGWRWLGHVVGAWILLFLCSGPCLRLHFDPQPVSRFPQEE